MTDEHNTLLAQIRKLYDSVLANPRKRLESMADRIPDLLGIIECLEQENKELRARLLDNPDDWVESGLSGSCPSGMHIWLTDGVSPPAEGAPCLCGVSKWTPAN